MILPRCLLSATRVAFLWGVGLLLCPMPARAADPVREVAIAIDHARLATQVTALAAVQARLHQLVNCLVGPRDNLFDGSAGNPCANEGGGAIPDTADEAMIVLLRYALDKAVLGLQTGDLHLAQRYAVEAQAYLTAYR